MKDIHDVQAKDWSKTDALLLRGLRWYKPMEYAMYASEFGLQYCILFPVKNSSECILHPPGASTTYHFDTLDEAKLKADELYRETVAELFLGYEPDHHANRIVVASLKV